ARKCHGLDGRMSHQRLTNGVTPALQIAKNRCRCTELFQTTTNRLRHELRSLGVTRMLFKYHGTSRSYRTGGIAARRRKRKRKIARAENRNRSYPFVIFPNI